MSEHVGTPDIGRNEGLLDLGETSTVETPVGSGGADLQVGDQVELLQGNGSWRNGWRIADVVNCNIGLRIRIEAGNNYRVVGPNEIRCCGEGKE